VDLLQPAISVVVKAKANTKDESFFICIPS
jgi:hypothetical protein